MNQSRRINTNRNTGSEFFRKGEHVSWKDCSVCSPKHSIEHEHPGGHRWVLLLVTSPPRKQKQESRDFSKQPAWQSNLLHAGSRFQEHHNRQQWSQVPAGSSALRSRCPRWKNNMRTSGIWSQQLPRSNSSPTTGVDAVAGTLRGRRGEQSEPDTLRGHVFGLAQHMLHVPPSHPQSKGCIEESQMLPQPAHGCLKH